MTALTIEEVRSINKVVSEITGERHRHIREKGWTAEHDDEHSDGELQEAAAAYCLWRDGRKSLPRSLWPWDMGWFKPKSIRRNLIKASALIIAEIQRIDRADKEA